MFLRKGFHGASLDEIAEEAGYTTGAVYSNFHGKDDLFLAVLDAEARRRFPLHTEAMLRAGSIEEGLRASAREMAGYAREHPGWTGVYVEFWTHASRRPELRRRVAERHGRLLDTVGGLVEEWPFAELLEVSQYQVVHDPAGLHVALVLREEAPADTPARVRAALARELHDAGAVPPPIDVTPVPELHRDPGHSAKLKLIGNAAPQA